MRLSFVILLTVLSCFASADSFNITSCYCHQKWKADDRPDENTRTGVFYVFDYWNRHLDLTLSMNLTELIEGEIDPRPDTRPPPSPIMHPICQTYHSTYSLCYWRRWHLRHGRVSFNGHIEKISRRRNAKHEQQKWAYPKCQELCLSEFGYLEVDEWRSTFGMWPEVKNICEIAPRGACVTFLDRQIGYS